MGWGWPRQVRWPLPGVPLAEQAREQPGNVYSPYRRVGPTRPAPLPQPNPALDCYIKSGETPRHKRGPVRRADCALGNIVDGPGIGDPVCFGEGAQHNVRCPEARRLARARARFDLVMQVVMVLAFLAVGVAAVLSIAVRTCGIGVRCG